jgi:hypothetical protein
MTSGLQSQAWLSFDWLYKKNKKIDGYFLFGGVVYLAIVRYCVCE